MKPKFLEVVFKVCPIIGNEIKNAIEDLLFNGDEGDDCLPKWKREKGNWWNSFWTIFILFSNRINILFSLLNRPLVYLIFPILSQQPNERASV